MFTHQVGRIIGDLCFDGYGPWSEIYKYSLERGGGGNVSPMCCCVSSLFEKGFGVRSFFVLFFVRGSAFVMD